MDNKAEFEACINQFGNANLSTHNNDGYVFEPARTSFKVWQAASSKYEARIAELEKAICIYCREEIGHIDFENDKQAINFFIEYTNKFE